jgi:Mn-dependent DtxR family transcriptional regulator
MEKLSLEITENESAVLEYVRERFALDGRAPSLKKIAEKMEWSAHSTAADVVSRLIRKGLLRRRKGYAIKLPRAKT